VHCARTLQKEVAATRDEMQQLRGQLGALQSLAQTDPLTRLRNRRGFEQAVAEYALGRRGVHRAAARHAG
jgi:GGDEF domain-containing protein